MSRKSSRKPDPTAQLPKTRMLADALAKEDTAGVALALRNDTVVVPLLPVDGPPQVRVFRRGDSDKYMLLLFSSPETYVAMLPQEDDHRVLGVRRGDADGLS